MTWRQSTRSLAKALGLAVILVGRNVHAAPIEGAPVIGDPIQVPLWSQLAPVLDSIPAQKSKYQLVSFSLIPSPNTLAGVFSELGAYNNSVWRFGHWRPDLGVSGQIQEAPPTVAQGLGYWLITRDSVKVHYSGTVAAAETVEVPLLRSATNTTTDGSWNQVGNPFPFNISTNDFRLVKRDTLRSVAAAGSMINTNIYVWNPATFAGYNAAAPLIPRGQGFWVRVLDRDTSLAWTRWLPDLGAQSFYYSSVKFDSKGNPHIAYYDGNNGDLKYAHRVKDAWQIEVVDATGSVGAFASLALDANDLPRIAYQDQTTYPGYFLKYASKSSGGAWSIETADPGVNAGAFASLALEADGTPHIAYEAGTSTVNVMHAVRGTGGWSQEVVEGPIIDGNGTGFIGGWVNLAVDNTGHPHVSYQSYRRPPASGSYMGLLRYARKSGSTWTIEQVDSSGDAGYTTSLAVDSQGRPSIASASYNTGSSDFDLHFASRATGSWVNEVPDATGSVGAYTALALSSTGEPRIAYSDFTVHGTKFTYKVGTSWITNEYTHTSPNYNPVYVSIALDPNGNPGIAYSEYNGSVEQLHYDEKRRGVIRLKMAPVAHVPALTEEAKPSGSAWAVKIIARQGERESTPLMIGVANVPSAQRAAMNSGAPPAPVDVASLDLRSQRFVDGDDARFVSDFVSGSDDLRWELRTDGGQAPGEQTLSFQGFDVPAGMKFYLTDAEGGWTREVRAGESVTLAAHPRTLELVATTSGTTPALQTPAEGLQFAYPNPFGASTGLSFTLSHAGDIRVDLFDVTGRKVRSIERTGAAPGEHVLVWDGRDGDGRSLPSGVYLARWSTGTATGARRIVRVE